MKLTKKNIELYNELTKDFHAMLRAYFANDRKAIEEIFEHMREELNKYVEN